MCVCLVHIQCTICNVPYAMYHTQCTICNVPYAMYHMQCTICNVPYSMYHTQCTIRKCTICNVPLYEMYYTCINYVSMYNYATLIESLVFGAKKKELSNTARILMFQCTLITIIMIQSTCGNDRIIMIQSI